MPLSEEDTHINVEVEEIRRKVLQLAQLHSTRHHCGSGVEEALREVGIDQNNPSDKIKVRIDFTVGGVDGDQQVEYDFDKVDLHGKTHEEQCAWVAESMSPTLIFGDTNFEVNIPVEVKDLNKVTPPPPRLERGLRFFKSPEGRVAHILHPTYSDTLCGGIYVNTNYARTNPKVKDGLGICKKCKERARTRYSIDAGDVV